MSELSSHPAADPQPATSVTASAAPASSAPASPAEVFDRLLHGVCDRRWADLPGLYAAQTHVVHPYDHRAPPLLTPAALRKHFEVSASVLGEIRFAPANVTVHQTTDPEVIVGEFEYVATVPGTEQPFRIPNIFVIRVRRGQIVQSRDYVDHAQIGRVLGARDAHDGRAAASVSADGDWRARARRRYEDAVFGGDAAALAAGDQELDSVEAGLALARGRILHARWLAGGAADDETLRHFEHAAQLYGKLGDTGGEAEALFWVATFHQAVRGDHETALPLLQRAGELAAAAGDLLTLSYVARHLGFVDDNAGRPELARQRLEESVRLRREIDFQPGVAAALLALAEFAASHGGQAETESLLNEAQQTASASGARGVQRRIDNFRTAR